MAVWRNLAVVALAFAVVENRPFDRQSWQPLFKL